MWTIGRQATGIYHIPAFSQFFNLFILICIFLSAGPFLQDFFSKNTNIYASSIIKQYIFSIILSAIFCSHGELHVFRVNSALSICEKSQFAFFGHFKNTLLLYYYEEPLIFIFLSDILLFQDKCRVIKVTM